MDNILSYKSFIFNVYSFRGCHHADNSGGLAHHHFVRLKSGNVRIMSEEKEEYCFSEGDVFYLPLGFRYHSHWKAASGNHKLIEWESYGFSVFPESQIRSYKPQRLNINASQSAILDEISSTMSLSPRNAGLLYLFLDSVLGSMKPENTDHKRLLFERAKKYIEENTDFKVPELAVYCNMSESGLYTFFREYAKTSPIALKNKIIVEKAIKMLELTAASVEEISDKLGFSNAAYFRKIVKKYTGKTPTKIRKNSNHI